MSGSSVLLRDVEVDGRRSDVLLDERRIVAIRPWLEMPAGSAVEVVDGRGGALLPGLHDHHLHLRSLAASRRSVNLAGLGGLDAVGAALRGHLSDDPSCAEWVRATGYHESIAGPLDRHVLDRLLLDRPVRVQHRSGALWMLNSAALERLSGGLGHSSDVERAVDGEPTGRLWRYDARLRELLLEPPPDMRWVGDRLRELGITSVTDATPDLSADAVRLLGEQVACGQLPEITALGVPSGAALPAGVVAGPRKIMVRDHDLSFEEISAEIAASHAAGRPVAIHCVTRESLVLVVCLANGYLFRSYDGSCELPRIRWR